MSSAISLTIAQGDTVAEGYTLTNSKTEVAPTADLTTIEVLIKTNLSDADGDALQTLTGGSGVTIVDANAWTITVDITSAQTAALAVGRHKWVCTTIDASSNTVEAFRGDFVVRQRGSDPSS